MLLSDEISSLFTEVVGMSTPTSIMLKVGESAVRTMKSPHSDQVCYRASSIGKPWILQVLGRWYPSETVFNVSTCMKMLDGIVAQAWAEQILTLAGYEFVAEQELKLQVGEIEVVGHADIIVTNHTTRQITVIECKSMGGHLIGGFYKSPNDDFGYVSQLSFYTEMVRRGCPEYTVEPMFLLYDRSLGKFKTCHITDYVVTEKMGRVESALKAIAEIPQFDLDCLLETVHVPPPISGVPPSMKWSKWAKCFYYEHNKETKMHDKITSKRLIENMTQNKIGGL